MLLRLSSNKFLKESYKNPFEEKLRVYRILWMCELKGYNIFDENNICYLSQEQILERRGYYYNDDNIDKFKRINKTLQELELIFKEKIL